MRSRKQSRAFDAPKPLERTALEEEEKRLGESPEKNFRLKSFEDYDSVYDYMREHGPRIGPGPSLTEMQAKRDEEARRRQDEIDSLKEKAAKKAVKEAAKKALALIGKGLGPVGNLIDLRGSTAPSKLRGTGDLRRRDEWSLQLEKNARMKEIESEMAVLREKGAPSQNLGVLREQDEKAMKEMKEKTSEARVGGGGESTRTGLRSQ